MNLCKKMKVTENMKFKNKRKGGEMKNYIISLIVTTFMGTALMADPGWETAQSTQQGFYFLETVQVDGVDAEAGADIIGAFVDRDGQEVCVGVGTAAESFSSVPLMGNDGLSDATSLYLNAGEVPYLKIYDATYGSVLDLTPGGELAGFENFLIGNVFGVSSASNTFGCTDSGACNYNDSATADDGSCASNDCAGECGGSAEVDDCGVCGGGNASMDCAGTCDGSAEEDCAGVCNGSSTTDNCGVCDDDSSNDDLSCSGCMNSDADNYDGSASIEDGSCEFTVPGPSNLVAEPGPARVYLSWDAAPDNFDNSTAGYTYSVIVDGAEAFTTSQTSTQVTGLETGTTYDFTIQAIHNAYGAGGYSNTESAAPGEVVGPTWRLKLSASIDGYGEFFEVDDNNWLGVAADASYGYDATHDIPEPPVHDNYISLYFPHSEWDEGAQYGDNFTEDIVLDDDNFFSHNLTTWDGEVISNMAGDANLTITVEGNIPANYHIYVDFDGVTTDLQGAASGDTYSQDFSLSAGNAEGFTVTIGNRVPTVGSSDLSATGLNRAIDLNWAASGGRYPATDYRLQREGADDINQTGTSYSDTEDRNGHEGYGLLYESNWSYTMTSSNLAGESTDGYSIRASGGAQVDIAGTQSDANATTLDNIDPDANTAHVGADCTGSDGSYEVNHNGSPDLNACTMTVDGSSSDDANTTDDIDRYSWSLEGDAQAGASDGAEFSFSATNAHDGATKGFTATLTVESDYWAKDGLRTRSNSESISTSLDDEPNADPVASSALGLIVEGDCASVLTSDDFDVTDGNDYDCDDQVWYEPHDNSGDQNDATAHFDASESSDADGDAMTYSWSRLSGIAVGFAYDDLNGNGEYDFGEPFSLDGTTEIYEDTDLGDWDTEGPSGEVVGSEITSTQSLSDDVYILTMTVTDTYGDSDSQSLVVGVSNERNEGPTAADHRVQPAWYVAYDDDSRVVTVDNACDGLDANDSDNDDLQYRWSYEGPSDIDLSEFNSDYSHSGGGDILAASADLGLGDHTFTFTVTDSYGESASASSNFSILSEPLAPAGNIDVVHTSLKYSIVQVSENALADFATDCHGEVYNGADWNTAELTLSRDGSEIASWDVRDSNDPSVGETHLSFDVMASGDGFYITYDTDAAISGFQMRVSGVDLTGIDAGIFDAADVSGSGMVVAFSTSGGALEPGSGTLALISHEDVGGDVAVISISDIIFSNPNGIQMDVNTTKSFIDESLAAETAYGYTLDSRNSDLNESADASSSDGTTTHDRPTVTVITPNGAEIASVGDDFDVDFSTTQSQYISKIEVFYLQDGSSHGDAHATSDNGTNSGGNASGNGTINFEIADADGTEINYDARVKVVVTDVGDYNGAGSESNSDSSDGPFTMAAHTLNTDLLSGWHMVGAPVIPWNTDLVDNFSGSLGAWGTNWVAYDENGQYDGLGLSNGQGYYLALAGDATLTQSGDPIRIDDDCADCVDQSGLADLNLGTGWSLNANPLVNKVSKDELTVSFGGEDLAWGDAVDAGWVSPTIHGWFGNGHESIDRLMPFGGYWINTSRDVTVKVRPHAFDDDGSLTREEDMWTMILKASDLFGEGASDYIKIGLGENLNNDFQYGEDEYDIPNPMVNEYIDMQIERQGWLGRSDANGNTATSTQFLSDLRSLEYEDFHAWNISGDLVNINNDIELSWDNAHGVEDDIHLIVDGEAINMKEEVSVEISSFDNIAIVVGDVDSYLNPLPEEFGLSAAYPNPFNPTTSLDLALNTDGMVNMAVYNVLGQVVEVLVADNMKAGFHTITWNATDVSSGMYFVRVEAGNAVATQKLMLLK